MTVRERVEAFDWAATALGPRAGWPVSLKSMMAMVLAAEQPMLLWWGPGLVQIYNDAFAPCLGNRHPAALGQPAVAFWQDVWPVVGGQIERVLALGRPTVKEDALVPIWRNGRMEEVYWSYTYTPVFDDDGALCGVLTICTETTARVLAQRRQQMLAAFSRTLGACASREDVIARAQAVALSNTSDIPAMHFGDAGAEPAEAAVFRVADAQAEGGLAVAFVLSEQLPFDDNYRAFLEQFTAAIGEAIAQVERARKHEIARADRDRLLTDAPVGTALLVGEDLVYHLANQIYCDIVDRAEIAGRAFLDVFPELAGTELLHTIQAAYRTGVPFRSEETHVRLRGDGGGEMQDKYFSFNLAPLRSVAGGVYGLMVMAVDITPHVVARKEIERLNADLLAAARAKDEFLAMLGHELRNPLAPIRAAADLLQLGRPDEARVRKVSEVIARQAEHMTHLLNDLLDVSRVTRGLVELDMKPVDCREIVTDAAEQVMPLVRSRRHQLMLHLPPDRAMVEGDKERLVQIVTNLLNNAAKYTQEGGRVELAIELLPSEVLIKVTDNGIGLAPDLIPRVFDLFTQAARSSDRSSGGLGLGLALVRSLVELHGGAVTCRSDGPGKGSQFCIRLGRLQENQPAPRTAGEDGAQAAAQDLRILVVDDNADAAAMLCMLLKAAGHEVMVEHAGAEALALARAWRPQACLLDIGLPGMSGLELAQHLRADAATGAAVLIAVTGYGQESDRKDALAAGFDHHLVKPIDTRKLALLLEAIPSG